MPDALEIDLSDGGPHAIDLATPSIEAEGDFDVVLRNHGAGLHVHLNLDPSLSRAARLSTANHYVEAGAIRRVRVEVDEGRIPAEGRLKIVTGYGSETEFATVSLVEPGEAEPRVQVDERLAEPRPREETPLLDPDSLPSLAFLAIAVAVAFLAVLLVSDPVVLAGVLVAIVGVGIAAALLSR